MVGKSSGGKKIFFSGGARAFALLALTCALCAMTSCKKKEVQHLEHFTPLSKKVNDLQESADWAYEIESGRLTKKIDSFESIAKGVSLNPTALVALEGGATMAGIFPELEGFTSLDTSNIQGEILDVVNEFCTQLIAYSNYVPPPPPTEEELEAEKKAKEEAEKKADSEKSDDEKNSTDEKKDDTKKTDEKKDDGTSAKIDAVWSERTLYSLVLFLADTQDAGKFKSYIVGRPFIGEDLIEVPVMWTCSDKKVWTKMYPVSEKDVWKIQQIEIYKEESAGGNNGSS